MVLVSFSESLTTHTGRAGRFLADSSTLHGLFGEVCREFEMLGKEAFRDGRPVRGVLVFVDSERVTCDEDQVLSADSRVDFVSVAVGG